MVVKETDVFGANEGGPIEATVVDEEQRTDNLTDLIPKAIMWNLGFGVTDMVLRSHTLLMHKNEKIINSSFERGLKDAISASGKKGIGEIGALKHGNVVALWGQDTSRFLRMINERVDTAPRQSCYSSLQRNSDSERFLVIEKDGMFAFYSLTYNRYIRENETYIGGGGGCVFLEPPRRSELFSAEYQGEEGVFLKTEASKYISFPVVYQAHQADVNYQAVTCTCKCSNTTFNVIKICDLSILQNVADA